MIDIIFLKVLQAIVVVKNNICVQHKIFLSSHDFLDLNVDICNLIRQSPIYSQIDGSKDKQISGQ